MSVRTIRDRIILLSALLVLSENPLDPAVQLLQLVEQLVMPLLDAVQKLQRIFACCIHGRNSGNWLDPDGNQVKAGRFSLIAIINKTSPSGELDVSPADEGLMLPVACIVSAQAAASYEPKCKVSVRRGR